MLHAAEKDKLIALGRALIDQDRARVIVPPKQPASGFWFGGGNMTLGPNGRLYVVGRYRNHGDSRTGLGAGERGLELAIFAADSADAPFEPCLSLPKPSLNVGDREVLSIEGSALRWTEDGVELYVSSEKKGIGYPPGLESFLKPGTGVWTVDRVRAGSVADLADAPVETVLASSDPRFVHMKDPFLWCGPRGDVLGFCTHPFCWTSSNTACAEIRPDGSLGRPRCDFLPRGFTWDVAMTRGTAVLDVPAVGPFAERHVSLLFYDGGECVRNLDEHKQAVSRPRGYSCEELGGLAYFAGGDLDDIQRLSVTEPLFVSPHGTGCSRYVDVLATDDALIATWQQSQDDRSQPLVMNVLARDAVEAILAG